MAVVEDLVAEGLQVFSSTLHSTVPLRHFSEFHDATVLNNTAQEKGKKVLAQFIRRRDLNVEQTCDLATKLGEGIQKQITQWIVINEDYKNQSECFMRKRVADLCEEFKTSVDKKLLISEPDMPLNELDTFLENRKMAVVGYFQDMSKAGDAHFQDEYKSKLEEKLECLRKETVEYQSIHLEYKTTEEARQALEEVKKLVLEMIHQLKSKVEACKGSVPNRMLKENIRDINTYLHDSRKGKLSKEHHQLFINGLEGMLTNGIRRLEQLEKYLLPEKAKEWVEGMDRKLNSYCSSEEIAEAESEDMQQTLTESESDGLIEVGLVTVTEYKIDDERSENGWDVSAFQSNESSASLGQDQDIMNEDVAIQNNENEEEQPIISISGTGVASVTVTPSLGQDIMDEDDITSENVGVDGEEETAIRNNEEEQPVIASMTASSSHQPNSICKGGKGKDLNLRRSERLLRPECITIIQGDCPMYRCDICKEKIQKHLLRHHGKFCDEAKWYFKSNHSGGQWSFSSKTAIVSHPRDPRTNTRREMTMKMKPYLRKAKGIGNCIRTHSSSGKGTKSYKCPHCNGQFSRKWNCKVHIRSHCANARQNVMAQHQQCEKCKQRFGSARALRFHMLSHEGSYRASNRRGCAKQAKKLPYGCSYCDMHFDSLVHLRSHVITHSGERPFKCPTCEYSAAVKKTLLRHIHKRHRRSFEVARKLANLAAVDYIRKNKIQNYGSVNSFYKIESVVLTHAIQKANLKIME